MQNTLHVNRLPSLSSISSMASTVFARQCQPLSTLNATSSLAVVPARTNFLQPSTPQTSSVRTHLGYIPFQGRLGRKLSNKELFLKQLKIANIQPVKKVTYTFDPIREDFQSIRNFMYFWNRPKVLDTNLKVIIKTNIVDDRSEPNILFNLNDGRDLEVKTGNLTELEIAQIVNYYLLPLVKEEEAQVLTKAAKGAGAGGKGRKGGKK